MEKWISLDNLRYAVRKIDARFAPKSHAHTAATASAAGFLSAADKKKLDALPVQGVYGEEF